MDPDRLRTLIAILRESGVTYFETDEVTLHLGPQHPVASQPVTEDQAAAHRRVMYGPIR